MAKVLIVDDVADNVKLLSYELQDMGHEVIETYSGAEALVAAESLLPDCVLLDVMMPEMNGYDVCRKLRSQPMTQSIPVIMVSAKDSVEDIITGLDAGADDYISKPINPLIAEARMRTAVRGKQAKDAITQANRQLEEARRCADEANRAKSEFLANMSHELRTPLNAVIGFSQGLLERTDKHPLNDHQKDRLEKVLNSGTHLLNLINHVLDIAKVESGKMSVDLTPCDLRAVAAEVQGMAEGLLREKPALQFRAHLANDLPTITTDSGKVRQILINLISNAAKFTETGAITLRIENDPSFVRCAVEDTGVGIPADQLERIFDKFYQVSQASKTAIKGTGLGLSICRSFAELLGGTLTVTSSAHVGSTFTLSLPLSLAAANGEPGGRQVSADQSIEGGNHAANTLG